MIQILKHGIKKLKEHKQIFTACFCAISAFFTVIFNWVKEHKRLCISCLSVIMALSIITTSWLSFTVYTVNVFDGRNTYTVRTFNNNVTAAFAKLSLGSDSYNIKNTTVSGRTTLVEIEYTFPVHITMGDKTSTISFAGGTVKDALLLAGFTPDEFDFTQPSLDTKLVKTTYIDYTDINYVTSTYTEAIDYKTETIYSDSLAKGESKTLQKGKEGVREITLNEKLVNGVSVEKNITSTKVLSAAVNAKKLVGTKTKPQKAEVAAYSSSVKAISTLTPAFDIALDANGNPVNYKSKMTCRATAYTYTGYNCSTGVAPQPGYIAVNPKVIPYGTKLYIKSADGSIIYGYAVAADTGGFVKKYPTGIDLFMPTKSACSSFGVRNMEVYIIG